MRDITAPAPPFPRFLLSLSTIQDNTQSQSKGFQGKFSRAWPRRLSGPICVQGVHKLETFFHARWWSCDVDDRYLKKEI